MDWEAIQAAVALVTAGGANRIDGDGWKVYSAGSVIRIDLEKQS